jgi:hypothetical protein
MVSWMAANASLLYFAVIVSDLHELPAGDKPGELVFRQCENVVRHFPERVEFLAVDIVPVAFGEPEDEECPLSGPEQDD